MFTVCWRCFQGELFKHRLQGWAHTIYSIEYGYMFSLIRKFCSLGPGLRIFAILYLTYYCRAYKTHAKPQRAACVHPSAVLTPTVSSTALGWTELGPTVRLKGDLDLGFYVFTVRYHIKFNLRTQYPARYHIIYTVSSYYFMFYDTQIHSIQYSIPRPRDASTRC